tara:strand:- start:8180 stop:8674 length:495 start_codon:yes stop_codon:yes gene_type:complete
MNIYKNFLDQKKFQTIENVLFGEFPWYYRNKLIHDPADDEGYYFTHTFIKDNKINSDYYSIVLPIIKKLKLKNIFEIRANLYIKRPTKYFSGFHIDNDFKVKTGLFYMNKNNGTTVFKKGNKIFKEVFPEKNKMVVFKSDTFHGVYNQTDVKRRIIINLNYESN